MAPPRPLSSRQNETRLIGVSAASLWRFKRADACRIRRGGSCSSQLADSGLASSSAASVRARLPLVLSVSGCSGPRVRVLIRCRMLSLRASDLEARPALGRASSPVRLGSHGCGRLADGRRIQSPCLPGSRPRSCTSTGVSCRCRRGGCAVRGSGAITHRCYSKARDSCPTYEDIGARRACAVAQRCGTRSGVVRGPASVLSRLATGHDRGDR